MKKTKELSEKQKSEIKKIIISVVIPVATMVIFGVSIDLVLRVFGAYIIWLSLLTLIAKRSFLFEFFKIVRTVLSFLKNSISLDWLSADIGKNCISSSKSNTEEDPSKQEEISKEERARYIKNRNYMNLFTAIIIFPLAPFLIKTVFLKFVTLFIIYRTISRSFELIFAFGKDVLEPKGKERNSNLKSHDRIKLAIFSYIELNLNFSVLYHIINIAQVRNWLKNLALLSWNIFHSGLRSIFEGDFLLYDLHTKSRESLGIIKALYKSIGISTASGIGSNQLGFFSALHSITAMVLVVFAIATYLGSDD